MSQKETLAPAEAFELALEPMRLRRWAEAAKSWKVLRNQYADHPTPWLQGAISFLRLEAHDDANTLLEHAREHFPKHSGTWVVSAEWARLSGNGHQEVAFLQRGREGCPPSWKLWYHSADCSLRLGDFDEASHFNSAACELALDHLDPWIQCAEIASAAGNLLKAEEGWKKVISLKPEYREGYARLADVYRSMGNHSSAKVYRLAAQYGGHLLHSVEGATLAEPVKRSSGVSHFLQMIVTKSLLNLKSESSRTHLNHAWVVMEPLLHLVIYYFLFGQLLNAGVENYGLFLLCGLVPWMWFSKAIAASSNSIISGQSLMLSSSLNPAFFPLVSVVQNTLKQLPPLLVLLLIGAATDVQTLSWNLLYLPVLLILQFGLIASVGLLVAAAVAFVRDLGNLVATGLMLVMFLSGVIYNFNHIPSGVGALIGLNPMALIIKAYRDIIMMGQAPDFMAVVYIVLFVLGACVAGAVIYISQRKVFVKRGMR